MSLLSALSGPSVWNVLMPLNGQSAVPTGRGIDWQLEPHWPIDPWWVVVLAGLVLAVLVWMHLRPVRSGAGGASGESAGGIRRWALLLLRTVVVLVLVWMLGRWQIQRYETDLPDLVLMLDASRSMTLPSDQEATEGGQTRWHSIVDLVAGRDAALLERLAREYRLRPWLVGRGAVPVSGEVPRLAEELRSHQPVDEASYLGDVLASTVQTQRGQSTAALVLFSDGIVTGGMGLEEAARRAAEARLPLYIIRTGTTDPPPQVAITELVVEPSAMVGDSVRVTARVRWEHTGGAQISVRLVDQDRDEVLASERIGEGASQGAQTVALPFLASEPGLRRLRVEVGPVPGEVALEDNQAEGSVSVRDESFRVLLVEGRPRYEFRFLKHLLERATSQDGSRPLVELTSVLQQGDARYAEQDRTARALPPVDAETLDRLDLIILSDCDPEALGARLQGRIADLVSRGGVSLVVIAGPDHLPWALEGTPLGPLMPVDPSQSRPPAAADDPFAWRLTTLGQRTPNLRIAESDQPWRDVPPLYWLARVGAPRPAAQVLLEAADVLGDVRLPVVMHQWVGSGQVWLQLTDETFRLRAADLDAHRYERYWLQLVRSLARRAATVDDEAAELTILGERFPASRPIPFEVQLGRSLAAAAGGQVQVTVRDAEGDARAFDATADIGGGARYRGFLEGLEPGSYRAVLTHPVGAEDPPSDTVVVTQDRQEMRETTVDVAALEAVARTTGGEVFTVDEAASNLVERLPRGREVRLRPLSPLPVWNHWAVALVLFAALSAEWILRRRWGSL